MGLFKKKTNWDVLRKREYNDNMATRDVHEEQQLERGAMEKTGGSFGYRILAPLLALFFVLLAGIVSVFVYMFVQFRQAYATAEDAVSFLDMQFDYFGVFNLLQVQFFLVAVFFISWSIIYQKLMMGQRAEDSMNDTTDINLHKNDQHIMLRQELQETFDWFPDVGAHSSVQVSTMISHFALVNKGLKKIDMAVRHTKDTTDAKGRTILEGEIVRDEDGNTVLESVPLIDEAFGKDLLISSGIPANQKELLKGFDIRKVDYNMKGPDGRRRDRDKLDYDTVADAINADWEFPEYEVQRPAGAYLVDTAPTNTMVLAITRAGKGQTYIEPTIDMWTREKRQNNIVINDPKGELLRKFYVPATVRGYEIVQFNLINPLNTDIYNPLGFAAEAARQGNFTKAASYIENIGDIFFPKEGADDPMWRARCCSQKVA